MSTLNVDKVDPSTGTALELGTSGDTITVPTGAGLTVVDEVKTNKISPATGTAFALGDSGDTFTIPSGATITNSGTATGFAGITEADQWRITAAFTTLSSETTLTANWERCDTHFDKIGTGMTESSGIFTFPSTGIWMITEGMTGYGDNLSRFIYLECNVSGDDGGSYDRVGNACTTTMNDDAGSNSFYSSSQVLIVDVAAITGGSTVSIRLRCGDNNPGNILSGSTTENYTYLTFIRLGDT
jgi:hypothetical protein